MFGDPLICKTLRGPGAFTDITESGGYTVQIPRLVIYALQGIPYQILDANYHGGSSSVATFEGTAAQIGLVQADWVTGFGNQPVQSKDILVYPDGSQYSVRIAEHWIGVRIDIYIEIPTQPD